MLLQDALQFVQIIISVALVVVVILQSNRGGLGGLFGGGESAGISRTRRGVEKTLFQLTVGLGVLFVANAVAQLLVAQ